MQLTINGHFGLILLLPKKKKLRQGNHRIILRSSFSKVSNFKLISVHENETSGFSNSSGLKDVLEKLRFRDGLVWTVDLKAAKYEIQKPSTCRATLFLCKFWDDFSRFPHQANQPISALLFFNPQQMFCCSRS